MQQNGQTSYWYRMTSLGTPLRSRGCAYLSPTCRAAEASAASPAYGALKGLLEQREVGTHHCLSLACAYHGSTRHNTSNGRIQPMWTMLLPCCQGLKCSPRAHIKHFRQWMGHFGAVHTMQIVIIYWVSEAAYWLWKAAARDSSCGHLAICSRRLESLPIMCAIVQL